MRVPCVQPADGVTECLPLRRCFLWAGWYQFRNADHGEKFTLNVGGSGSAFAERSHDKNITISVLVDMQITPKRVRWVGTSFRTLRSFRNAVHVVRFTLRSVGRALPCAFAVVVRAGSRCDRTGVQGLHYIEASGPISTIQERYKICSPFLLAAPRGLS